MRLLITRPKLDAQHIAALLRSRGHEVIVAPLLRIEPIAADFGSGRWDAVVTTSANSCRALAEHPRRNELTALPIFAVGARSAEAARASGFADVTSADGDAKDLARLLTERFVGRDRRLLYLAGEDRAADLAAELASQGVAMKTVVIYRAVKVTEFPPPAREALQAGQIDGVLHFSRRSAEAFLICAESGKCLEAALAAFHYCLSPHVARPLLQAGAASLRVAARPDEAAMIELVGAAG
jgi:uroporphyrinogen-III synthase